MITSLLHINEKTLESVKRYFEPFLHLPAGDVRELLKYCEVRHFSRKETILKAGQTDDYLNIVVSGLVRKCITSKRKEDTLQLATEGHIFTSEISFLMREPSEVCFQALEPTTVISLRHDKMEEALVHFTPGEKLGRMILTRMYIKKGERIYIAAAHSPRERFLEYINRHPHMLRRVPQKYLASYLQIKPETFSRMKKQLLADKKIGG